MRLLIQPVTASQTSPEYADSKDTALMLEQLKETDLFYAIFSISPTSTAITTLDGQRVVGVNDGFARLFGYEKDEITGRVIDELDIDIGYEDPDALVERLWQGEIIHREESRIQRKDGQFRRVISSFFPVEIQDTMYVINEFVDVTEIHRLRQEVLTASEGERRRIGRDLHDGVGSQLTAIGIMLSNMITGIEKGGSLDIEKLKRIEALVNESSHDTRRLSHGLNPIRISRGELTEALQELAANTDALNGLACSFQGPETLPELPEDRATHLYWIAQEATNNARKHGRASRISIRLEGDEKQLILAVRDNGRGLSDHEDDHGGLGLHTMRYRAHLMGGDLEIKDAADGGTVVQCVIALDKIALVP